MGEYSNVAATAALIVSIASAGIAYHQNLVVQDEATKNRQGVLCVSLLELTRELDLLVSNARVGLVNLGQIVPSAEFLEQNIRPAVNKMRREFDAKFARMVASADLLPSDGRELAVAMAKRIDALMLDTSGKAIKLEASMSISGVKPEAVEQVLPLQGPEYKRLAAFCRSVIS